ncbi:MAG TPA: adenylosuccinate synthetase [Propionibacteriaceae bacterium]|nr:adenylosuccinate synthetase [Propionibacteriaceae bacterium]
MRPTCVVGLGFGDEGKGATVDWLCSFGGLSGQGVSAVVRYNGGGQAAHNVVAGGVHHTFRQLGSGSMSGVPTYLSQHHRVDVEQVTAEARQLERKGFDGVLSRVSVHPDALLVTPVHEAANRAREQARGEGRHGSTGLGIGETTFYAAAVERRLRAGESYGNTAAPADAVGLAPRASDLRDRSRLTERMDELVQFYEPLGIDIPSVAEMVDVLIEHGEEVQIGDDLARYLAAGEVVFEGAQGALLDEHAGFHPYTTWSSPLPSVVTDLVGTRPYVIGVTRTIHTRHGAGPFPSEDTTLDITGDHNRTGEWQGHFRFGALDLGMLRYGLSLVEPDALSVTWADLDLGVVDSGDVPVVGADDLDAREELSRELHARQPHPLRGSAMEHIAALGRPILVSADGPDRERRVRCAAPASTRG